jgi:superfamily II DNA or RNA helicase
MRNKMSSSSGPGEPVSPTDERESLSSTWPESAALLAAFRAMSISDVYAMGGKDCVVRGYGYYRDQRLQQYRWSEDGGTLTARVQGTRLYRVTFSIDDGFLTASCDCPVGGRDALCKHILCACFTTKNLLSPDSFKLPDWQHTRSPLLRTELLGSHAVLNWQPDLHPSLAPGDAPAGRGPVYEVVIDADCVPPQVVIHKNGAPLSRGWSPGLPPILGPLLNTTWSSSAFGEDPFRYYLNREDRPYPVVLKSGGESFPLEWDPSIRCQSRTAIDLSGNEIRIRTVCLADGAVLERIARVGNFVADPGGGRLLSLEDERGWASFRLLRQAFTHIDPFGSSFAPLHASIRTVTLPDESGEERWSPIRAQTEVVLSIDDFQSAQIDVVSTEAERTLRSVMLTVEGQELPVQRFAADDSETDTAYVLILTAPDASADQTAPWTLQAQCRRGERSWAPSASAFSFIPALEQGRGVSTPLRAQKRKAVLYTTFFSLLSVPDTKEQKRQIQKALSDEDWSYAVSAEAASWLRHQVAVYAQPILRLGIHDGRWALQPVNKAREAWLYRIPFDVFGPDVFRGMQRGDEMTLPAARLFQGLPQLFSQLTAAGIPLLYRGKPLTPARWDVAVHIERDDAARPGIDWFEIRPEIRSEGTVLDESEWRAALRQGGLIEDGSGLRLLDAATLERLRAIFDLTGEGAPDRAAGRIVQVPRLQVLDWLALREQGITVSLPTEEEDVLGRLLGFTRIETPPLPPSLHAVLRPYQQDGYAWLAFLYAHRFGACLADDMGLGKTVQAIGLLAALHDGRLKPAEGVKGPHLIVVPTSLLFNWEQELARFAPDLQVHVYSGSERKLEAKDGDVVLTTYGLVRRDRESLARRAFHVIVFDEAQAVKNIHADTTGAVRRLNGRFKIALTGTPLENHLGEYFSIIDLCLPGLLGEYDRFKKELKQAEEQALNRLLRRTRPFILRRTKAQILHDLPPKIESEVFLDLTERQKALYQKTVDEIRSTIDHAYRSKTSGQAQFIALTAILKLRQVCLSPRLLTDRADESSPKLSFLVERLQVLLEEGHSALVFSQFTSFLDLVEEACVRQAVPYQRLDGATALQARKTRVTAFQTGERPGVFLLSLKAGGQGLNLTKANYVFHLDPWWNPAVENQASDRAHRIGQQRAVTVVRILMRHSIEEKMMALKQRKLELYDAVMGGVVRGAGQNVLTQADFEFLLAPSGG